MIDGTAVTVTVGDGMSPLPTTDPTYAAVTQIVAKGNLAPEGTAYKLTLAEGDEAAITVTLSDAVPEAQRPVAQIAAKAAIRTLIMAAQDGDVTITVDEAADPDTMTVMGSFLDTLVGCLRHGGAGRGTGRLQGRSCMVMARSRGSVAHDELRKHVVLGVVSAQQAGGDAGLPRMPAIGAGGG